MAENIINQNLQNIQDPETEFGLRPNTDNPMPIGVAMMPQGVRDVFDVASNYNYANNLQNNDTSGGYLSNLRHGTAASQMRDALGGGPVGILGANVLGLGQELTGLAKGVTDEVTELFGGPESSFMNTINQTGEDIYANLYGSLYGKKGTTAETYADLANKFATDTGFINTALDATANKQNSLRPDRNALNRSDLFNAITNYGTAQAAEVSPTTNRNFVDAGRDFSMFDQARMGQARMGDAVSGTNVQGMDLEMDLGAFMNPNIQPSQNMFERFGGAMQGGLESLRNKAGSIADFIPFIGDKSLTGMAMQGLGKVASGLGNMFERRDGMATVDEFGNLISGADLDKQNALGGYYTDAARASRRRGKSIAFMQRRKAEGKKYGERRLEKLLADQAKEDAARQKAFEAAMAQGQGFYDSLNQGRGASVSQSSREQAGAGYNSVEQGSPFADGGLASMFVRRG